MKFSKKNQLKIIVFGLFSVFAAYLLYINLPHSQSFNLDVGSDGDIATLSDIFVDAASVGPIKRDLDTGRKYREINSAAGRVYFHPKYSLGENQTMVIDAVVKADTDTSLYLQCPEGQNASKQTGAERTPLNKDFFPTLMNNFTKVASFGDLNVYAENQVLKSTNFDTSGDFESWFQKNVLARNFKIKTIDYALDKSIAFVKQNVNNSPRNINLMIRGNAIFTGYFTNDIDVTVSEKDLNWYSNANDVEVNIVSLRTGQVVASTVFKDDGFALNKEGLLREEHMSVQGIEEGLYSIEIKELVAEGEPQKADFVIPSITVNTDKFVVRDQFMLFYGNRLYYDADKGFSVNVNAWTENNLQRFLLNRTIEIGELTLNDLNKWKEIDLPFGQNEIFFEKGLRVNAMGHYFAFYPDMFFDPYGISVNETEKPDIVLSRMDYQKDRDGWIHVAKQYRISDVMSHCALPYDEFKKINKFGFWFSMPQDAEYFSFISKLKQEDYNYLLSYGNVHIFSKKDRSKFLDFDFELYPTYESWIKSFVPYYSVIGVQGVQLDKTHFVDPDLKYVEDNTRVDFSFKSNTRLAVYLRDAIHLETSTSNVYAQVLNSKNEIVLEGALPLQGEVPLEGVYLINFTGTDVDTSISDLVVNSDKVVFLDSIDLITGAKLFVNETMGQDVRFKINSALGAQVFKINESSYPLTEDNVKQWIYSFLEKGQYVFSNSAPITIEAQFLAPSKSSFFTPFLYHFDEKDDQQFLLVSQDVPHVLLDEITVRIE